MHASTSYKVDFTGIELDNAWLLGQPGHYPLEILNRHTLRFDGS